jgi:lipopolysaccharide export system permease protein
MASVIFWPHKAAAKQRAKHLTLWQFGPSFEHIAKNTGETIARIQEEFHSRLAGPLLVLATALLGFTTIYIAGFSRFGSGRYIVFAIFLLVIIKAIESAITDPTRQHAQLWYLIYAPALFGILSSWLLIAINDSGILKQRRNKMQGTS